MSPKIEDATREQVALFLPEAIAKTVSSYCQFIEEEKNAEKSKHFSEHHKAGRVAIAHLELLLKLARWADLPCEDAVEQLAQLEAMMSGSIRNNEAASQGEDGESEDLA